MRTFKVLIIVILAVCFTLNAQQTPAKKTDENYSN